MNCATGECIGWTVYPESGNYYSAMIAGCKDLSIFQSAAGILFGGIGIPVQYCGFETISKIIAEKSEKCAKLVHSGAVATAFWGSAVHLLYISLMLIKKENSRTINYMFSIPSRIPIIDVILQMYRRSILQVIAA